MRKIKMLSPMVFNILGKDNKVLGIRAVAPGEELEWNATEAQRFVDRGYAQFVNSK